MPAYFRVNPAIPARSPFWSERNGDTGLRVDMTFVGRTRKSAIGDGVFVKANDVVEVNDRDTHAAITKASVEVDGGAVPMFEELTPRARTVDLEGILRGAVTQAASPRRIR